MEPKKFLTLVCICLSLVFAYTPVQALFYYQNCPRGLLPYSWSRIHDPVTWNEIIYYHVSDNKFLQYMPWSSIVWNFTFVLFFGLTDDAFKVYRGMMIKYGLGKIFPRLNNVYDPTRQPPLLKQLWWRLDLVGHLFSWLRSREDRENDHP